MTSSSSSSAAACRSRLPTAAQAAWEGRPTRRESTPRRAPSDRFRVRTGGFEPPISCTPSRRDGQASLRSDASSPCGSRTLPARLERPMTSPEVERAASARTLSAKWVGRCSNPRLRLFRPPLVRLSYRPNEKSPASLATPGFWGSREAVSTRCHKRRGCMGSRFAGRPANCHAYPRLVILGRNEIMAPILTLLGETHFEPPRVMLKAYTISDAPARALVRGIAEKNCAA